MDALKLKEKFKKKELTLLIPKKANSLLDNYCLENTNYNSIKLTENNINKIKYIIAKILGCYLNNKKRYNEFGYAIPNHLYKQKLQFKYNKDVSNSIRLLLELNIIEKVSNYSVIKQKANCYQFSSTIDLYSFKKIILKQTEKRSWINTLLSIKNQLTNVEVYQMKMLDLLSINNKGIEFLNQNIKIDNDTITIKNIQANTLYKIQQKQLNVIHNSDERLYSTFTSLSKKLRPYLLFNNKELVEIDLSNCQLLLGYIVIKDILKQFELKETEDTIQFKNDCLNSLVYQKISEKAGLKELYISNKKLFKKLFMFVWFGKNKGVKKDLKEEEKIAIENIRNSFKFLYPNVFNNIQILKCNNNNSNVARLLQSLESSIMIDKVSKILMDSDIQFLNLHDAIFINDINIVEDVKNTIQTVFETEFDFKEEIAINVKEVKQNNNTIVEFEKEEDNSKIVFDENYKRNRINNNCIDKENSLFNYTSEIIEFVGKFKKETKEEIINKENINKMNTKDKEKMINALDKVLNKKTSEAIVEVVEVVEVVEPIKEVKETKVETIILKSNPIFKTLEKFEIDKKDSETIKDFIISNNLFFVVRDTLTKKYSIKLESKLSDLDIISKIKNTNIYTEVLSYSLSNIYSNYSN